MTILVAGAAAIYDLICVSTDGEVLPGAAEVKMISGGPGAAGRWLPGGAALTIALTMAAQQCAIALFHPLPPPGEGDEVRRRLRRSGVDLSRCPVARAAHCLIVQPAQGRLAWSSAPELSGMTVTDTLLDGLTHIVVASRWGAWTDALLREAARRSIPCSLVGEAAHQAAQYRWYCVVLDAAQTRSLPQLEAEYCVITQGAGGALLKQGGAETTIPAAAVTAVDPTGAGDAFGASFLARLLAGDAADVAASHAAVAAARTCTGWGAWHGLEQPIRPPAADATARLRGALLGLACGDAFGMPNSFLQRPQWRDGMQPGPAESPYHRGYEAGRITDDTEQALALTAALEDGFTPLSVATRLQEWFVAVGGTQSLAVGPSTRRAMLAFQAGEAVEAIGRTGTTNGAAMRVAPIGVFAALRGLDLDQLVDLVEVACVPTHNTGSAIAGAAAIAAAVAAGIAGADWPQVIAQAQAAAVKGALRGFWIYAPNMAARIAQALRIAASCEDDASLVAAVSDVIGAGEPSIQSVPAALAIADYTLGDPSRAILLAGNLRGDTDTVAAMAGAICGAYAGDAALPGRWADLVARTNGLDVAGWAKRLERCATASG